MAKASLSQSHDHADDLAFAAYGLSQAESHAVRDFSLERFALAEHEEEIDE